MIKSIFRSVGSVILALAVAFVLIALNELPGYFFHPFPEGFDQNDMEACRAHVAGLPTWLLAAGAVGWGVAVFASVWLATRLGTGRHPVHGIAVGSALCLVAIYNMAILPYATWFYVANAIAFPLGIYWGTRLARGQKTVGSDKTSE